MTQGIAQAPSGLYRLRMLDATTLKLLAAGLMLLDHIHQMYAWNGAPLWLSVLGRPVFPLFLFLAAESFHYTHSKRSYLFRLLLGSWGMTLLTFLLQRLIPNEHVVLMNNAFSTFFVTALYMLFWDWFRTGIRERKPLLAVGAILCCLIPVVCAIPLFFVAQLSFLENITPETIRLLAMTALLVPNILTVEGGFAMVALGLFFYIFRNYRMIQAAGLLLLSAAVYMTDGGGIQWMMCAAVIPMLMYDGRRGRGWKSFFYIFYPAHICILYLVSVIVHASQ